MVSHRIGSTNDLCPIPGLFRSQTTRNIVERRTQITSRAAGSDGLSAASPPGIYRRRRTAAHQIGAPVCRHHASIISSETPFDYREQPALINGLARLDQPPLEDHPCRVPHAQTQRRLCSNERASSSAPGAMSCKTLMKSSAIHAFARSRSIGTGLAGSLTR
jgi:hypothetical protein